MLRLAALLSVSLTLLAPLSADAKCARSNQAPKVLTKSVSAPAGGGIVVATIQVPYDVEDQGEAMQPTWRFAGAKARPKTTVLAPGLVVYRPASGTEGSLIKGTSTLATLAITTAKPTPIATPSVKAITHEVRGGRGRSATTTLELTTPPPANVVAIILADASGKPRSFGLVAAGEPLEVFHQRRCGVLPNGTEESSAGDEVVVFFVGKDGRLSAASNKVKVTGTTQAGFDE